MADKKADPIYLHALREVMANEELPLPADLGVDLVTDKPRNRSRAARELRKMKYELRREGLTKMKIEDRIKACEEVQEKPVPARELAAA